MPESDPSDSRARNDTVSRIHFCPQCRKPLRRIQGKMGPFWGCTGYPACRTKLYDRDGRPSTEADENYRCPVCTRPMVLTSNTRGSYWYCTGFRKGCKVQLADNNGRPGPAFRCRQCGQLLVLREGRNGKFWGCKSYPDCTATYNDLDGRPDIDILPA